MCKTIKNWSGGRLGVIWDHLRVLVAHLGVIWVHFGDGNSTNMQKPAKISKNRSGGLCKTQKTYKNPAKTNKTWSGGHMGGLCQTQKTYKNLAKTNKNWSGGLLGVIWDYLGVLLAHLGVIWVHFGEENSKNIQKPG